MTITSEISYINIFSCSVSMGSIGNGSQGGSKDLLSFHNDTSFLMQLTQALCTVLCPTFVQWLRCLEYKFSLLLFKMPESLISNCTSES